MLDKFILSKSVIAIAQSNCLLFYFQIWLTPCSNESQLIVNRVHKVRGEGFSDLRAEEVVASDTDHFTEEDLQDLKKNPKLMTKVRNHPHN